MKTKSDLILESLSTRDSSLNPNKDILSWIERLNRETVVKIIRVPFAECKGWFIDENGVIRNGNNTFFQICGLKGVINEKKIEQPIIIQDEIGFLGILCKIIDDKLYFLMQAKIEPGNINKIQLSPTIQATKSNFTKAHGGKEPKYLKYFKNAHDYDIWYDQIQSEQSSRFLGKRNRNMIVFVEDEVEMNDNWKWMTLGQIKEMLKYDNIVNMDSRTVLSGLPILLEDDSGCGRYFNDPYINSFRSDNNSFPDLFYRINNRKMFSDKKRNICSLRELKDWNISDNEIRHKDRYHFKVSPFDIEIDGREVRHWTQPLFEAIGEAKFMLLVSVKDSKLVFLTQILDEVGTFDYFELAPTMQKEAGDESLENEIEVYLSENIDNDNTLVNVMLSEEGGRFYQEQNQNLIIYGEYEKVNELIKDKERYVWADYYTLLRMMLVNNVLNIQLRNLLSLLDINMIR